MSDPNDLKSKLTRPLDRPGFGGAPKAEDGPQAAAPVTPGLPVPVPQSNAANPGEDVPAGAIARLLGAISRMLAPKPVAPDQPKPAPQAEPTLFTVMVAAMNGDTADGAASHALFKQMESKGAFKVRPLPRPFVIEDAQDPASTLATLTAIRHCLADENGDLMIWGDVSKDGYVLRLSGCSLPDEEKPASFGPTTRIDLPLGLGEAQIALLYAACLAAIDPANEGQKAAQRRLLPQAAQPLELLAAKPPVSLSMPQQRTIQLITGHVCCVAGLVVAPSQAADWLQKAANCYRAAEKRLNSRIDPPWEAALLRKHLAAALTARAERVKERTQECLEEAVTEWRNAAQGIPKERLPQEWAAAHTRLGNALYRLDLMTGDSELLREALTVLQAALQVHSRAEAPTRWAEIMHTIAQVLEVYGDQMRNPDVLKRAADAARTVLEVRNRDRTPLAWAAARNTLGSALFLLDKHGGGVTHLGEALEAVQEALEVFTQYKAKGPAQVAARNLAHVRKLAEDRKARQFIDPDWAGGR